MMRDDTNTSVSITDREYHILEKEFKGEENFLEEMEACEVLIENNLAIISTEFGDDGDIDILTKLLAERKIPYDRRWEEGSEYIGGDEYTRLIDGEYKTYCIYDDDYHRLNEFKSLLKEKDIIQTLKDKIKELEPFKAHPLMEPNSVKFSKEE